VRGADGFVAAAIVDDRLRETVEFCGSVPVFDEDVVGNAFDTEGRRLELRLDIDPSNSACFRTGEEFEECDGSMRSSNFPEPI
jgi:hypothetical protein